MDNRKIEKVAEAINSHLVMLTDGELQELVSNSDERAFTFNLATAGIVIELIGQAMQEDDGCPTDRPLDARFGPLHRAANIVGHELERFDFPYGDWLFKAMMETVGVSREKIEADSKAERQAQEQSWARMQAR